MPVSADQLRDLFALGMNAQTVLEVVTIFERDSHALSRVTIVTDVTRSRELARARKQKQRAKSGISTQAPGANDAGERAECHADGHALSRVTEAEKACDLSYLLTESQSGIREVSKKDTSSVVEGRKARVSRGTRLDKASRLSDEDRQFARDNGMTEARIDQSWAEFIDYWISVPGQRGTKLDWPATWRNRVRTISTKQGGPNGQRLTGGARQSGGDAFLAGLASVAARISGNNPMAGPASEEIPSGRFNIDGF